MVKKIVSGGQTGADQAALDVAIKLGIPHGGWIPKGRITEDGVLEEKYQLQEMETANYNKRTEQNVIDSEGTLIVSRGTLTGGSEYTREMAVKHHRAWLHIDLKHTIAFQAAQKIGTWIAENNIAILNVAGPRASKDPKIYQAVVDILEAALHLDTVTRSMPDHHQALEAALSEKQRRNFPQSVDQAVEKLLSRLSLRDKTMIANIPEENLMDMFDSLEEHIRNEFRQWLGNEALMESCRSMQSQKDIDEYGAALVIINELWRGLQKTNVLRIVK